MGEIIGHFIAAYMITIYIIYMGPGKLSGYQ